MTTYTITVGAGSGSYAGFYGYSNIGSPNNFGSVSPGLSTLYKFIWYSAGAIVNITLVGVDDGTPTTPLDVTWNGHVYSCAPDGYGNYGYADVGLGGPYPTSGTTTFSYGASTPITGTASVPLPNPVAAFSGYLATTGTVSAVLANPVAAFSGYLAITGTVSAVLANPVATFSGLDPATGTAYVVLPNPVASFTGGTGPSGTLAVTLPNPVAAFSGPPALSGSMAVTLPNPVAAFTGLLGLSGSMSATMPALVVSMYGSVLPVEAEPATKAPFGINDYTNFITSEHRGKARFTETIRATTQPAVDVQSFLYSLPSAFDLDTSIGVQLDADGAWVGISRLISIPLINVGFSWGIAGRGWGEGIWKGPYDPETGIYALDDDTYRKLIRLKILVNNWDGLTGSASSAFEAFYASDGSYPFILDNEDMSMTACISGARPPAIMFAIFAGRYVEFKPASVRILNVVPSVPNTPAFGFGTDNEYISGWGTGSWVRDAEDAMIEELSV
ncbi:MAG TPA: DUF2612 domain-containing protein [Phycisphaerales bacterium]|nr:DUF2612 domain-containing protein [Phycisphaerales bacterium]